MSKIDPVRPIWFRIFDHAINELLTKYEFFRSNQYRIVDDTKFVVVYTSE